jgi:hypothetical protein
MMISKQLKMMKMKMMRIMKSEMMTLMMKIVMMIVMKLKRMKIKKMQTHKIRKILTIHKGMKLKMQVKPLLMLIKQLIEAQNESLNKDHSCQLLNSCH